MFGWFASLAGTLFLRRDKRSDVARMTREMRRTLDTGALVVLFPEGTTSDGRDVLPFTSSLLEPATRQPHGLSAGFIEYSLNDGSVADEVCYWRDMRLLPHLLNLLGKRGLEARLRFTRLRQAGLDRKQLARQLRSEVVRLKNPCKVLPPSTTHSQPMAIGVNARPIVGQRKHDIVRMKPNMTSALATTDENPVAHGRDSRTFPNGRWQPAAFRSSDFTVPEDQIDDTRRIVNAASAILAQGEDLLRVLSAETYTRGVPLAFNACIGGHYRHCLDHFTSLLRGLDADTVDYDHRERDVRIEAQPDFALALTQQMRAQLERLPVGSLDAPVRARCEVSYAHGHSPVTGSTFGREMVYAIAHAIHHYALISVMARLMGANLPEHFGVAPSTVAHSAKQTSR